MCTHCRCAREKCLPLRRPYTSARDIDEGAGELEKEDSAGGRVEEIVEGEGAAGSGVVESGTHAQALASKLAHAPTVPKKRAGEPIEPEVRWRPPPSSSYALTPSRVPRARSACEWLFYFLLRVAYSLS